MNAAAEIKAREVGGLSRNGHGEGDVKVKVVIKCEHTEEDLQVSGLSG